MAKRKRSSPTLKKAIRRAMAMRSISPCKDLGNGYTLRDFWVEINCVQQDLKAYNALVSRLKWTYHDLQEKERHLAQLSDWMVNAIATQLGKSSTDFAIVDRDNQRQARKRSRQWHQRQWYSRQLQQHDFEFIVEEGDMTPSPA